MWTEFVRSVSEDRVQEWFESGWRYENGLVMFALRQAGRHLGSASILATVDRWLDAVIAEDGVIRGYQAADFNLDNINPGKLLWSGVGAEQGGGKYRRAVERLMDQVRHQPRTASGGFWHKKIYPEQMWLDGIYMAAPFVLEYGLKYDAPEWVDEALAQVALIDAHTREPVSELRYHGWDESRREAWANPETGCSSQFWGRSVGWLAMALVDLIEGLPETHPGMGPLTDTLTQVADGLVRVQNPATGLWWQVLDRPQVPGNYEEASVSAMAVYALAKGVRLGVLKGALAEAARLGYQGIEQRLCRRDRDGGLHLTQCNAVSGLGGSPYRDGSYAYYVQSPVVADEPKAVAALILAGVELERTEARIRAPGLLSTKGGTAVSKHQQK